VHRIAWCLALSLMMHVVARAADPPRVLRDVVGYAPLVHPGGAVEHYHTAGEHGAQTVTFIRSEDRGATWSEPATVMSLPVDRKWAGRSPHPMLDRDGALHLFLLDVTDPGKAWWHVKRPAGGAWTTPRRIGPCGPQTTPIQLRSGRIVVPIGYFLTGTAWDAPAGRCEVATWHSDDAGDTWTRSPDTLVVHMTNDYPGRHTGGYEPVVVELPDGRVWMLIRTQNGWLYESFSDDGARWSPPRASDFRSSDAPGALARLSDGAVVLVWNHCDSPPPVDGQWVYTGRDALHAAISDDGGATWRGFREVYLDPLRDENPPATGDRGTAYPNVVAAPDDTLYLVAGQGRGRVKLIHFDPAWLRATRAEDDFAQGLSHWSTFKSFGPVERFRRERAPGAQLVPHPANSDAQALRVRRPDERDGDGAAWSFPTGKTGKITLRLMIAEGFGGGRIALTDRFIYPQDTDLSKVAFALNVPADGAIGTQRLTPGAWHTVELAWRVEHAPPRGGWPGECVVSVDGVEAVTLPQLNRARFGLSYLRLHAIAPDADAAGMLIERVAAEVEP